MSDNYTVQTVTALLTSTTTDRTKTVTADASCTENFWAEVKLPAAAADTVLLLNLLTDPKILVVAGGTGISFKLNSIGTDAIGADPIAVVSNEDAGLSIDQILLSNSSAVETTVTVIAAE